MPKYVTDFGDYSVKNIKSFQGREGYGYNCNLYRNGKKVAFCYDDASGGGMHPIEWDNAPRTRATDEEWETYRTWRAEEERLLAEHIATLPPAPPDERWPNLPPLTIDEGLFVEELVNRFEEEKEERKIERQCKTKTLFRLSTNREGS